MDVIVSETSVYADTVVLSVWHVCPSHTFGYSFESSLQGGFGSLSLGKIDEKMMKIYKWL